MKYFLCSQCQNQVFFANSHCMKCGSALGYVATEKDMGTFQIDAEGIWTALNSNYAYKQYKPCFNYSNYKVCNWMLPIDSSQIYCEACQLTHIIPDLNNPDHIIYWGRIEHAKRRFLYLMQQLNIMPRPKKNDEDSLGLRFEFLMPEKDKPVLTGHAAGVITLNVSEADVVHRETTRINMGENYRTLLGHFRHESGHYYFDLMQYIDPAVMEECRKLFGDERQDYAAALQRHYNDGPPSDWQQHFVSSYASTHPWEDWAETWSHYLHMMDTLETAYHAGLIVKSRYDNLADLDFDEDPIGAQDFEKILQNWMTVTFNLNALNRSMGLEDAYPFTLPDAVLDKLRFIHKQILEKAFYRNDSQHRIDADQIVRQV